jgi:hypothetical protein
MAPPRKRIKTYNEWNEKQIEAFHSTRQYLYTLYGGAKGGGKSVGGVRMFQCDVTNYRNGVFVVMRKNFTVLHNTTKQSFEKELDPNVIVRKTKNVWYCVNGNQIWFWAADHSSDAEYEKSRGLEVSAIMQDEASEGTEKLYELMPSLLRQPAYSVDDGSELPGYIYLTSNPVPGTNYLKRVFIDPRTRKNDGQHNFIQSLPDDNPLLPPGYIDKAFSTMNPALVRMLRFGDWDVEQSEFQIVSTAHLNDIAWTEVERSTPVACGIDIGLGRPDASTVYLCDDQGYMWREMRIYEYDTMNQTKAFEPICDMVANAGGEVWIDAAGVGKGVADALMARFGDRVIVPVTFSESPRPEEVSTSKIPYKNLRAQLYFWMREAVQASAQTALEGERPSLTIERNDELFEEFENTFYLPRDGKLAIEPKVDINSRLGRSPDDADGAVLCNAALRSYRNRPVMPSGQRRERPSRVSRITNGY